MSAPADQARARAERRAALHQDGPSQSQLEAARDVVGWYFATYFRTLDDPGLPMMFADPTRFGHFAVDPGRLRQGDDDELFKLLVTTAMFQRRQDRQIMRILLGINAEDARQITSSRALLQLVDESPCPHNKSNAALLGACDLAKTNGVGVCAQRPTTPCHLKEHTVLLKRYGHFGKVPTSAALNLHERSAGGLSMLFQRISTGPGSPRERAMKLEAALCGSWRVSEKIAAMFISAVSNPDVLIGAPWQDGIDWRYFVVIDSNVDLFLGSIGYSGAGTYAARRGFVVALARSIDLRTFGRETRRYNPRIVQQAMYTFMSRANRLGVGRDCNQQAPSACTLCVPSLALRCAFGPE